MSKTPRSPVSNLISVAIIAAVAGGAAGAFAYTAGWLSPHRISPDQVADAFGPKVVSGHRLNHAKGICFVGAFHSSGAGVALSKAPMLALGDFPVVGRLNLGTPDPFAKDSEPRVRGVGMMISAPGGAEWRMAMINAPVFAVSTPQEFYGMLQAGESKDPDAMAKFAASHPEMKPFLAWAKTGPWTASYAEERFSSLNSFDFTNASGATRIVRWMLTPEQPVRQLTAAEFAKSAPDALEREISARVAAGPVKWLMQVQVAGPGDPTSDPTKTWPANRQTVTVGEVVIKHVIPEPDGPCRDLNFDPTVLPAGISTSDDPFPAARSAVYSKSYDRRSAGAANYLRNADAYSSSEGPENGKDAS